MGEKGGAADVKGGRDGTGGQEQGQGVVRTDHRVVGGGGIQTVEAEGGRQTEEE